MADRGEAVDELAKWEHRTEITPNYEAQRRPSRMAVYRQLTQTNYRDCGEATCMGYAFGLIQGSRRPEESPVLTAEQLATLELLL